MEHYKYLLAPLGDGAHYPIADGSAPTLNGTDQDELLGARPLIGEPTKVALLPGSRPSRANER